MRTLVFSAVSALLLAFAGVAAHAGDRAQTEEQARQRARAEEQVKADLARRTQGAAEAIRVVESAPRTWPDARLGCLGRQLSADPVPVPGYRIVLEIDARRYVYHADREGRFVPCDRPAKPIDRIR